MSVCYFCGQIFMFALAVCCCFDRHSLCTCLFTSMIVFSCLPLFFSSFFRCGLYAFITPLLLTKSSGGASVDICHCTPFLRCVRQQVGTCKGVMWPVGFVCPLRLVFSTRKSSKEKKFSSATGTWNRK